MQIEIYKTACSSCGGTFYELDGALDNCPHCNAETDEATTNDTLTATVEIDWRTGVVTIKQDN
ncbi:hypothetical protein [Paenibacillus daejeonensis]|uniref:hypothetical protein n=1 Tax=Paenibacillus daejeonensis TaxID=135193 RepID=UPI000365F479|nr:hypothetical protein [Paenibacillus daejeonensis]